MEESTITNRRSIRWDAVVGAAIALLLLVGMLLGITQMFILLVVLSLLIIPV